MFEYPEISPSLNVHSHAALLAARLSETLQAQQTPRRHRPRKQTITDATWQLVLRKRDTRAHLARLNEQQRLTHLGSFFAIWNAQRFVDSSSYIDDMDLLMSSQDRLIAQALHAFRTDGRLVSAALRRDDIAFFDKMLAESADLLHPQDVKKFWNVLRRSLPRFKQRKMQLAPARIEALEQQMIPHLCQLEMGSEILPAELLHACHNRQVVEMQELAANQQAVPVCMLPSLTGFESALRSSKNGKATGLDNVPSGVHHAHAPVIAKLYYGLLLKMHLWCVEPLQFKGGIMTMIPKKGSPTCAANYRGILLLATVAKRMHGLLRSSLMKTLGPKRVEGQLGGFPKQMVQFGFHAISLWTKTLEQQGFSTAVLYLDLTSAFHHLIRETVLGVSQQGDFDHLVAELQQAGHPLQANATGQKIIGALEALGGDPRLLRLLRDVHTDTWFTVTSKEIVRTTRGTRPGSPLADSVFHVIMTHIITEVRQWLLEKEMFQSLLAPLSLPTLTIVWADDVAIPLAAARAGDLLPFVQELVRFVDAGFARQGFTVNYDFHKTNVVISFQGQDAPSLRKQYLLIDRPGMMCDINPERAVWLHFKPYYKHLGFTYSASQSLEVEMRQRIGQAQQAMSVLGRPILANRHIPEHMRVRLFNVFIATRLFYGLGTWRTPSLQNMKLLRSTFLTLLKKMLRIRHDARCTNGQVFQRANTLDIRQILALDRLRYARKLSSATAPNSCST